MRASWLLQPWLAITAAVITVPVLRRAALIWRDNYEAIEQRWRHLFAR
jgi:hypothetical protein